MTLTNANLYSNSYSEIKSFLESISGIDPKGRSKTTFIHASMPNVNASGFEGYPFIVLSVDVSEDTKSFDRVTSNKTFRVRMTIYSNEATDIDSMTDKIHNAYKDDSNLTSFDRRTLSTSPFNYDLDISGRKILFRHIGLIMSSRI